MAEELVMSKPTWLVAFGRSTTSAFFILLLAERIP